MIILGKCNGSCDAVDDWSTKKCAPSETKDVNVKVFNTITRINEFKTLVKYISCDCKWKFDSPTCSAWKVFKYRQKLRIWTLHTVK